MNIQEFTSSLITTAEEGKSIMNLIIGMNPSGSNVLDSLIGLYDAYPESVKKNKKAFAPTFYKLFCKYVMTEKHLQYYREFSKVWGPSELAVIKEKYSELLKNEEKQTFKNSLEFSKAFSSIIHKGNSELAFSFLESNLDILLTIMKKGSAKFIENLSKNHCWEFLIKTDYNRFKKNCESLSINHIDVLKKEWIDGFYGFKYLFINTSDETLLNILTDIKSEENFFGKSDFLKKNCEKESRHQCNILEAMIYLLCDNKQKSIYYLLTNYIDEVEYCMSEFNYDKNKKFEALNSTSWTELFKNIDNGTAYFAKYEIDGLKNRVNKNFKILETIILEQELPKNDAPKQKKIKL